MSKVMKKLNSPYLTMTALVAFMVLCAHSWKEHHAEPKKPPVTINDIIKQGELDLDRHHRMEVSLYRDDNTKTLVERQALAYNFLYEIGVKK